MNLRSNIQSAEIYISDKVLLSLYNIHVCAIRCMS